MNSLFNDCILKQQHTFHPIVEFNSKIEKLVSLNLSKSNTTLTSAIYNDINLFKNYINDLLKKSNAKFGIGGYLELRELYSRSALFNSNQLSSEPRNLHLGTDIWGNVNTPIFAFTDSIVHSFANNNQMGDYGATIILQHQIATFKFYTLYGHLSLKNIQHLNIGDQINKGDCFAYFGAPHENGYWPPHLHFQVILNLEDKFGDYPGVCAISEKEKYIFNGSDPDLFLQLNQFI
jgi:peptidoglycan LD-endopeptidase LytH